MVIVILILSKKYKNDVTGGGNVDKYEVVKFVLKMAKNDNLHMEFGVVQKMLSYTTEMVLIFATIPKCSDHFYLPNNYNSVYLGVGNIFCRGRTSTQGKMMLNGLIQLFD